MLYVRIVMFLGVLGSVSSLSIINGASIDLLNKRAEYTVDANCPEDYTDWANVSHEPFSSGKYQLGYQRPPPDCRTFVSEDVENAIEEMKEAIADPDLFRLFENCYPNTLDTTVKWRGTARDSDEELTFVITGDM